jgi:transcriptional regulator of nitric oxide reductase
MSKGIRQFFYFLASNSARRAVTSRVRASTWQEWYPWNLTVRRERVIVKWTWSILMQNLSHHSPDGMLREGTEDTEKNHREKPFNHDHDGFYYEKLNPWD